MSIKVDNLENLFWDNGSFRFPNTHPHLINGKWLEKVTPVMTTPITGWVVLTGEFNYCEYKGELFFLKKDALISEKKNKWRYILIKDHICSLFKNKANVLASGTLINGDLDKLENEDFQFTLSVFNNFNKRILLPLKEQAYNWKKHIIPVLPNKTFEIFSIDNTGYSTFLRQIENNKAQLTGVEFPSGAKDFTVLGKARLTRKKNNWKNELVQKIKKLLNNLNDENIVLSKFPPSFGNSQFLRNKYVITYKTNSVGALIEEHLQVLNLDLSSLTDIELVSSVTGQKDLNTYFRVSLKEIAIDESRDLIVPTYIKKLTRRNRVSFLNEYSTRLIYERGGKLNNLFYSDIQDQHLFPQKIYCKIKPPLIAKSKWQRNFPAKRKQESYRSVYLYFCKNLDFVYKAKEGNPTFWHYTYKENNFVDPNIYLSSDESNKSLATSTLQNTSSAAAIEVGTPEYESYFPWKKIGEPLNIGWLVGQFSTWLNNQESLFEADTPFIVKTPFNSLHRIKGLTNTAIRIIQNEDIYEPTTVSEQPNKSFTLDIFGVLPPRARQATQEEDFLIGEKLLFTTWGTGVYLLFQPVDSNGYSYTISKLDKNNKLLSRYLTNANWHYAYALFGEGDYLTYWAKQWLKKAYENFEELSYKNYYSSPQNFQELKEHIKKNTTAYFVSENVDFSNTPIGLVKAGDIFFSDLEYYFYDDSEGKSLKQSNKDWFYHTRDLDARLEDGEIVVYHNIKNGGLSIGKASVWDTETVLPEGQFIAEGTRISSPSSNENKLTTRLTKITKLNRDAYQNFDDLLVALRSSSFLFLSDVTDFSLDELSKTGTYLFDLKGTNFLAYLDNQARVHLVFKESSEYVKTSKKKIYSILGNEAISKLDKTQWVNQKVNLSIYGQKIEIPAKAFNDKLLVNIDLDTAEVNKEGNLLDSHKVEVSHALGKTYLRFDTPKLNVVSTAVLNTVDIERMDIMNMRATQDYLIKREEFEIGLDSMDLEHSKMRFENEMEKREIMTNAVLNGLGLGSALIGTGLAAMASGGLAFGAGAALSMKLGKGMITNFRVDEKWEFKNKVLEEKIALSIKQQAINSYTLDLTHNRQKEDYLLNLRRSFANQSFHQASSRERNQALDDKEEDLKALPRKEDKEIYLELWTISDKQKEYAKEYHQEYGVDCRVSNYLMPIGNGMKTGVYKMESVELHNLSDRVDLLLLKALLENGIQIVEWIEHEQIKELIPEDPRIAKLQKLIDESKQRIKELENEKELLDNRVQELTTEISQAKDEEHRLNEDLNDKKAQLEKAKEELKVVSGQLEAEVQKYDDLSIGYRKIEEERDTEKKLKNLYLDQKNKANSQLRQEKRKVASLTGDKKQLQQDKEELTKSLAEITLNRDALIKDKDNCLNREKELNRELTSIKEERDSQKLQIDSQLEKIKELESKPAGTSLSEKRIDYLITKDTNNNIIIAAWNSKEGIWQENPDLAVKKNTLNLMYRIGKLNDVDDKAINTDNYEFLGRFVQSQFNNFKQRETKYDELTKHLEGKQQGSAVAKPQSAYAWLGRVSIEVDHNTPYLKSDGSWPKKYWYHSTKGWFDYDIGEGAKEVNSLEQYKELNKNAVADLTKELQETKDSLAAVREIETQLRQDNSGRWAAIALGQILGYNILYNGYFINIDDFKTNTVSIYAYSADGVVVYHWKYSQYDAKIIYDYRSQKFWAVRFRELNWDYVLTKEVWDTSYSTDYTSSNLYYKKNFNFRTAIKFNSVAFALKDKDCPFVYNPPSNDNYKVLELYLKENSTKGIWWDPESMSWKDTEVTGMPKITMYTEYLDFLGLKWDETKRKAVPKSLLN